MSLFPLPSICNTFLCIIILSNHNYIYFYFFTDSVVNARKPNSTDRSISSKVTSAIESALDSLPENDSSIVESNESRTSSTSGSSSSLPVTHNQTQAISPISGVSVSSTVSSSSSSHHGDNAALVPASYCGGRNAAGLHWPPTPLNRRHEQPCPGNSIGQARWQCTVDGWQPESPDLSACRSSRLRSLRQQLASFVDRTSSLHIYRELLNLLRSGGLFSSDLPTILWMARHLLIQSNQPLRNSIVPPSNQFSNLVIDAELPRRRLELTVELVSQLLDERRRPSLPARFGSHVFGDRLIRLLQTAVGQLTATLNQDGSTNLEADNVLLTLHILDPEMPITLLFPTAEDIRDNRWMQLQDSIQLPARALNDFASNGKPISFFLNRIKCRFFVYFYFI